MLENFLLLAAELWQVGVTEIYIDGSFVEEKDRPNDIDGYFVVDDFKRFIHKELHRALNAINKDKIWTWSASVFSRCGKSIELSFSRITQVLSLASVIGVEETWDFRKPSGAAEEAKLGKA